MTLSGTRKRERKGFTVPRIFTAPLRELTAETSLGFEVIEFAAVFLGVKLYPWQEWLLIHALELLEDGSYRFRRVIVLVARQNGKSLLASVLAAWWVFVDSARHPDRVPPIKFKILGTAQNLDTARDVWQTVREWCDPAVDAEDDENVVRALQSRVRRVSDTNGKEEIILKSGVRYLIRAASRKSGRGKSAPRTLMDEMREQLDWSAWDSISQTSKAMWSPQLWGFSNAGDARSVVLNHQRMAALEFISAWSEYVDSGLQSAEDFEKGNDVSLGLFEWSAPDGCALDDVDAILQSNPSIGYGAITVRSVLADIRGMTEAGYRTEVLCQWVTALLDTHIETEDWSRLADAPTVDGQGEVTSFGSAISETATPVIGVDTAGDRGMSYVAVAGLRDDDLTHVEVVAQSAGMLWVVPFVVALGKKQGANTVAIQARGCPAAEFVEPLKQAGFHVVEVSGSALGASAGIIKDRVRDKLIRHRAQPILDMAISGGVTKPLGEVRVWDRTGSVVDVAPAVAVSNALYALESVPSEPPLVSAYVLQEQGEEPNWW